MNIDHIIRNAQRITAAAKTNGQLAVNPRIDRRKLPHKPEFKPVASVVEHIRVQAGGNDLLLTRSDAEALYNALACVLCDGHSVLFAVSRATGVPITELRSRTRGTPSAAVARMIAMYLMHKRGESSTAIGKTIRKRPCTIHHACRRIKALLDAGDQSVWGVVKLVEPLLTSDKCAKEG